MECQELQCYLCDQDYSDHRVPRNLTCGHSFCSTCLDEINWTSRKCPECRCYISENKTSKIPINYPLLRLCRVVKNEKSDPSVIPELNIPINRSSSERHQDAGKCPSHGHTLFFMCFTCNVWVCRDCLVVDHPDPPRGKCFILSVADAIDKIKTSHKRTIDKYIADSDVCRTRLKKDSEMIDLGIKNLQFLTQARDFVNNKDLEESDKQKQGIHLILSTLENIENDLIKGKEKMTDCNSPKDILIAMEISTDCQSHFEMFLTSEQERKSPDILNMLLRGEKDLKELLEEGKSVNVVKKDGDGDLGSWIGFRENRLHLYSLRKDFPHENGITLPFESVRSLVPQESPMVFLEVGWGGEIKGRVYVRLFNNSPTSRQVVELCSGERGSPYRNNTCFHAVIEQGEDNPHIHHDYQDIDNVEDRIIAGIVHSETDRREIKPNIFFGWNAKHRDDEDSFSVHFDDLPLKYYAHSHGFVEQGLDILKEVAQLPTETQILVMDCGLIIP